MTTVNHLNKYVFELTIKDSAGHTETIHPTGFHKFYSVSPHRFCSRRRTARRRALTRHFWPSSVVRLTALPGPHRVYNMTVEGGHVYRVSELGVLVHNNSGVTPTDRLKGQLFERPGAPKSASTVRVRRQSSTGAKPRARFDKAAF